jgi:hypothetical protein
MTSTNPWDDPDLTNSSDYYRFENVGDKASGRITRVGKFKFEGDDRYVPQLTLKDDTTGEDMDLTAKQVQLKAKLNDLRPIVGDHITVTFTHEEKTDGGRKTKKCFSVAVNSDRPEPAAPVAASVAAPVAPAIPDPAAAAAAIANLTPEQLATLGLGATPVAG